MKLSAHMHTALRALLRRRLRSTLSSLGVTCGVGSLVAMLAVAEGARMEMLGQLERLGTNTVVMRANTQPVPAAGATIPGLIDDLSRRLSNELPGLSRSAPLVELSSAPVESPVDRQPKLVATNQDYFAIKGLRTSEGRLLIGLDAARSALVCVLGAAAARDLGSSGRVGARLECGRAILEVVGILEPRTLATAGPRVVATRDFDRTVFVPVSAATSIESQPLTDQAVEVTLAFESGAWALRSPPLIRRCVARDRTDGLDFEVVIPSELIAQAARTQRIFSAVLGAVATISLLVGGIGIMNIMLVSVAERTREIGLRRAVGASSLDIAVQFLAEALSLTGAGALAGVVVGFGGAELISRYVGWTTDVSRVALLAAVCMALIVGILSGLYPAWKAARLNPIAALRSA